MSLAGRLVLVSTGTSPVRLDREMDDRDFEDFCRREYPAVFRACVAFSGSRDTALEATQEAFARAFARWRRLRRNTWAGGWVMTTALNVARRSVRDPRSPTTSARPAEDDVDLRLDVATALAALPPRQRQAVVLHYLADLPVGAVAELMNASEGSVKTHLSRARRALGTSLLVNESGGNV